MKRFLASTIAVFILLGTITCGAAKSKFIPVKSIKLSKTSLYLDVTNPGIDGYRLKVIFNPSNATDAGNTITWTSSDKSIATAYDGAVSAFSDGVCKVTASLDGKKATCTVTTDYPHYSDGTYTIGVDKDNIYQGEYTIIPTSTKATYLITSNSFKTPLTGLFMAENIFASIQLKQ